MAKRPINYHGLAFDPDMRKDKRQAKWAAERKRRGFDSTELWNLDRTIAAFVLPRLKAFAKDKDSHPSDIKSLAQWKAMLAKMILALEIVADGNFQPSGPQQKTLDEGLKLFGERFCCLWN